MTPNKSLDPLIQLCATERGTKSKVLRLINHRRTQQISWKMLSGWLNPNESERVEPRFNVGMELMKIQEALCGKQQTRKETNEPTNDNA